LASERYAKGNGLDTGRGTRTKTKQKGVRSLGNMVEKKREE